MKKSDSVLKQFKTNFMKMDFILLLLMILFSILGCVIILSASSIAAVLKYYVSANHFFIRQIAFTLFGIIGGMFIINIKTKRYGPWAYIATIIVFVSLFCLPIWGIISNGAKSWYDFGVANFQPSEFTKSVIIIFSAIFYAKYQKKKKKKPIEAIVPLAISTVFFLLIAMQPDLGGAIINIAIAYFIFLASPIPNKIKKSLTVSGIVGVSAIILIVVGTGGRVLDTHQINRFKFTNPCERYLESSGYQVCNGFIAINNGGLFGVGLGNSTQKYLYLPEAHTDFIFPIVVEELGLLVGIGVILGYMILLYRILKIAKEAGNIRNSILAYGTFIYILCHILVNLLGVLALMPLTGVPLPFLSYGGSFTINLMIMLFVVQRVAIENKIEQEKRQLKLV